MKSKLTTVTAALALTALAPLAAQARSVRATAQLRVQTGGFWQ